MSVHASRLLKEELARAIDKQLQLINYNIMLFISLKIKNKAVLNLKPILYALLRGP